MEIIFKNKELQRFFETKDTKDKFLMGNKSLKENFLNVIYLIELANNPADLTKIRGLWFEKLKGMKTKNKYSVYLNIHYRLEFLLNKERQNKKDVYICTIIEISSHYGGKRRKR